MCIKNIVCTLYAYFVAGICGESMEDLICTI